MYRHVLIQEMPQLDIFLLSQHRRSGLCWSCVCRNVCNTSTDVLTERAEQEPVDTVNIVPVKQAHSVGLSFHIYFFMSALILFCTEEPFALTLGSSFK